MVESTYIIYNIIMVKITKKNFFLNFDKKDLTNKGLSFIIIYVRYNTEQK